MNIIQATSRGKDLTGLPLGTHLNVRIGGQLSELRSVAESFIPPPYGPIKRRMHIYFICGIPDITTILKNKEEHYRECIYAEEPQTTIDRLTHELQQCKESLVRRGALPIFATIARVSLANYNNYFVTKNKTSYLKHSEDYTVM